MIIISNIIIATIIISIITSIIISLATNMDLLSLPRFVDSKLPGNPLCT